ncbi:AEC family transporter [Streptococcus tangpeifui]|uniref:Membrane protein n=1 Tax=Streptococcus criceti HS-6 TaxID=873449 RepID=G5JSH1_STRCG|nr:MULTISPECIES: AEC family transporter [Streptococcus]EHI74229.1 putative membrane protein [Streptococcus criceti HS-6]SUN42761.1 membrane transport protein [Streptococcus criceti]
MSVFLQSISGIVTILIMVLVGYVLAERGWFDDKSSSILARLVTQIGLPCYMIETIFGRFSAHDLRVMLPQLRYPALSMVILLGIAMAVAQIFQVKKSHRGLFTSMFFNSNTVFVGLPINQALFGDKSIPYVLVYYMCNTTFFWTIGLYLIQRDGETESGLNWQNSLKKIFSAPLLGFMAGVALVLLKVQLPDFLLSDLTYLGNITIPLSMIFIGLSISKAGLSHLRLGKDHLLILLGRFVVAPLLMTLMVLPAKMPHLMKEVFIIQSAMPVMTNAPVVSKLYGADADYAAIMVTETTLMTLIVIPILMVLLG